MAKSVKSVTLRMTNKARWGQTIILPGIGETPVGKDGLIELEEDAVATVLLNQGEKYTLVKGNGTTVTAEAHPDKVDEESPDYVAPEDRVEATEEEKTEEVVEEETEEATESNDDELSDKTLSELLEIAEASGIDADEYKKFKKSKKLMVNFLKKYMAE